MNTPENVFQKIEVVSGSSRDRLSTALHESLVKGSIGYSTGGKLDELRPRFHFRHDDLTAVASLLTALSADMGIAADIHAPSRTPVPIANLAEFIADPETFRFNVWIREREVTPSANSDVDAEYTVMEFDFWRNSPIIMRGNRYAAAPRPNDFITDARWQVFDRMIEGRSQLNPRALGDDDKAPNLYDRDFPIDVVYTWVDDQDPQWIDQKSNYRPAAHPIGDDHEGRADHPERFRSRDELKYSLRSLEMFAPFVRKIFLVTMDQTPEWLDTSHPQIEMVSHRDIYSDQEALPTFNSSSIETQLHHIEGLAEHFIYFNDDVFLGQRCSWQDFFLANGTMKFFPAAHSISAEAIDESAEEYLVADRNAIELFTRAFDFTVHKPMCHLPHPSRRSVLYELEERFKSEFDACQRERFRSSNDLRPIAFMAPHFAFYTHRGIASRVKQRYLALWKPLIKLQLDNVLQSRKYKTFCINDAGVPPERESQVDTLVADFLEGYFPHPSSFERV